MVHPFPSENDEKTKMCLDKNTRNRAFKIGDKLLIANHFYMGNIPKLAPNY